MENFSDPSIESLDPQEPLPIPFIDEEIRHKARRCTSHTIGFKKIGMTPDCRACYAQSSNHTPECVARHEEAFGREIEEPPQHYPDELEDLFDDVAPNRDELEPFQEVDCDYSPTSEEVEEGVPECLFQVNLKKNKKILLLEFCRIFKSGGRVLLLRRYRQSGKEVVQTWQR